MVINVEMSEEVVQSLSGIQVVMNVPEEVNTRIQGEKMIQDLYAVLTPGGLVCAFELEPDEMRLIKKGVNHFLIQFINTDKVPPFRIIFDRETTEFGQETTNGDSFGFKGDSTPE